MGGVGGVLVGGAFGFAAFPPPVPEDEEDTELVEGWTEVPAAVEPLAADVCVPAFAGVAVL